MCGAGVITANVYGTPLLTLKLIILALLTLWLYLNFYDMSTKNYQYFKQKSWLFIGLFLLIVGELFLNFSYLSNIDTHIAVSCCSTLFGQLEGANPLPFGLTIPLLLLLFFLLYALTILTLNLNYKKLYIFSNLLFLYIAYYAVVYFFGTYIYQLPTHKCPFCMLQSDYFYIGYLVWGFLFIGTFIGISDVLSSLIIDKPNLKHQKLVSYLLSLFVLLCTSYVAVYWLKNGVLLWKNCFRHVYWNNWFYYVFVTPINIPMKSGDLTAGVWCRPPTTKEQKGVKLTQYELWYNHR